MMPFEKIKTKILRAVSVATLCFFVVNQSTFASPAAGIEIAVGRETPGFLQIDIPAELASLDDIYEAPSSPDPKLVLHIQNAHANYDAQQKIKQLLAHLNKAYSINTIFVEGASERLDPDYLKFFPDDERNLKLADFLAKEGELTGAELYLIEAGNGKIRAEGIEDADLYRANYEALKKVFGSEVVVNRYIEGLESRLETISSKIAGPDMRRMLSEWKKFEKGRREFMPFIKSLAEDAKRVLNLDLESLFSQVEWPQITRLLVLQQMEKELRIERSLKEKEKLVEFLNAKRLSKDLVSEIENFKDQHITVTRRGKAGTAEAVKPRDLLERLAREAGPKGFLFSDYPDFSLYAGYLILKSELDSKGLFGEINRLFREILDKQAVTPNQKELLDLYRDEELVRKLLRLELTRADWQEADAKKAELAMDPLVERLRELGRSVNAELKLADTAFETKKVNAKFRENVAGLYDAAYSFYDYARKRETVFYEKMAQVMGTKDQNKAILITGGFHTDGVSELLREHEISYGILTPRLMEKSDENLYRTVMLQNREYPFNVSYLEQAIKAARPENVAAVAAIYMDGAMRGQDLPLGAVIAAGNQGKFAAKSEVRFAVTENKDAKGRAEVRILRPSSVQPGVTPATARIGDITATKGDLADWLSGPARIDMVPEGRAEVRGNEVQDLFGQIFSDTAQQMTDKIQVWAADHWMQIASGIITVAFITWALILVRRAGPYISEDIAASIKKGSDRTHGPRSEIRSAWMAPLVLVGLMQVMTAMPAQADDPAAWLSRSPLVEVKFSAQAMPSGDYLFRLLTKQLGVTTALPEASKSLATSAVAISTPAGISVTRFSAEASQTLADDMEPGRIYPVRDGGDLFLFMQPAINQAYDFQASQNLMDPAAWQTMFPMPGDPNPSVIVVRIHLPTAGPVGFYRAQPRSEARVSVELESAAELLRKSAADVGLHALQSGIRQDLRIDKDLIRWAQTALPKQDADAPGYRVNAEALELIKVLVNKSLPTTAALTAQLFVSIASLKEAIGIDPETVMKAVGVYESRLGAKVAANVLTLFKHSDKSWHSGGSYIQTLKLFDRVIESYQRATADFAIAQEDIPPMTAEQTHGAYVIRSEARVVTPEAGLTDPAEILAVQILQKFGFILINRAGYGIAFPKGDDIVRDFIAEVDPKADASIKTAVEGIIYNLEFRPPVTPGASTQIFSNGRLIATMARSEARSFDGAEVKDYFDLRSLPNKLKLDNIKQDDFAAQMAQFIVTLFNQAKAQGPVLHTYESGGFMNGSFSRHVADFLANLELRLRGRNEISITPEQLALEEVYEADMLQRTLKEMFVEGVAQDDPEWGSLKTLESINPDVLQREIANVIAKAARSEARALPTVRRAGVFNFTVFALALALWGSLGIDQLFIRPLQDTRFRLGQMSVEQKSASGNWLALRWVAEGIDPSTRHMQDLQKEMLRKQAVAALGEIASGNDGRAEEARTALGALLRTGDPVIMEAVRNASREARERVLARLAEEEREKLWVQQREQQKEEHQKFMEDLKRQGLKSEEAYQKALEEGRVQEQNSLRQDILIEKAHRAALEGDRDLLRQAVRDAQKLPPDMGVWVFKRAAAVLNQVASTGPQELRAGAEAELRALAAEYDPVVSAPAQEQLKYFESWKQLLESVDRATRALGDEAAAVEALTETLPPPGRPEARPAAPRSAERSESRTETGEARVRAEARTKRVSMEGVELIRQEKAENDGSLNIFRVTDPQAAVSTLTAYIKGIIRAARTSYGQVRWVDRLGVKDYWVDYFKTWNFTAGRGGGVVGEHISELNEEAFLWHVNSGRLLPRGARIGITVSRVDADGLLEIVVERILRSEARESVELESAAELLRKSAADVGLHALQSGIRRDLRIDKDLIRWAQTALPKQDADAPGYRVNAEALELIKVLVNKSLPTTAALTAQLFVSIASLKEAIGIDPETVMKAVGVYESRLGAKVAVNVLTLFKRSDKSWHSGGSYIQTLKLFDRVIESYQRATADFAIAQEDIPPMTAEQTHGAYVIRSEARVVTPEAGLTDPAEILAVQILQKFGFILINRAGYGIAFPNGDDIVRDFIAEVDPKADASIKTAVEGIIYKLEFRPPMTPGASTQIFSNGRLIATMARSESRITEAERQKDSNLRLADQTQDPDLKRLYLERAGKAAFIMAGRDSLTRDAQWDEMSAAGRARWMARSGIPAAPLSSLDRAILAERPEADLKTGELTLAGIRLSHQQAAINTRLAAEAAARQSVIRSEARAGETAGRARVYRPLRTWVAVMGAIFSLMIAGVVHAAVTISLAWDPPTNNTDGTPLTDLGGYKVYWGTGSRNYTGLANVGNVTQAMVGGLVSGTTYYFAVSTYNKGLHEGSLSDELVWTAPTSVTGTVHKAADVTVLPEEPLLTEPVPSSTDVTASLTRYGDNEGFGVTGAFLGEDGQVYWDVIWPTSGSLGNSLVIGAYGTPGATLVAQVWTTAGTDAKEFHLDLAAGVKDYKLDLTGLPTSQIRRIRFVAYQQYMGRTFWVSFWLRGLSSLAPIQVVEGTAHNPNEVTLLPGNPVLTDSAAGSAGGTGVLTRYGDREGFGVSGTLANPDSQVFWEVVWPTSGSLGDSLVIGGYGKSGTLLPIQVWTTDNDMEEFYLDLAAGVQNFKLPLTGLDASHTKRLRYVASQKFMGSTFWASSWIRGLAEPSRYLNDSLAAPSGLEQVPFSSEITGYTGDYLLGIVENRRATNQNVTVDLANSPDLMTGQFTNRVPLFRGTLQENGSLAVATQVPEDPAAGRGFYIFVVKEDPATGQILQATGPSIFTPVQQTAVSPDGKTAMLYQSNGEGFLVRADGHDAFVSTKEQPVSMAWYGINEGVKILTKLVNDKGETIKYSTWLFLQDQKTQKWVLKKSRSEVRDAITKEREGELRTRLAEVQEQIDTTKEQLRLASEKLKAAGPNAGSSAGALQAYIDANTAVANVFGELTKLRKRQTSLKEDLADLRRPARSEVRLLPRDVVALAVPAIPLFISAIFIALNLLGVAVPSQHFATDPNEIRSMVKGLLGFSAGATAVTWAGWIVLNLTVGRDVSIWGNFMRMLEEARRPTDWTTRSTDFVDRDLQGIRGPAAQRALQMTPYEKQVRAAIQEIEQMDEKTPLALERLKPLREELASVVQQRSRSEMRAWAGVLFAGLMTLAVPLLADTTNITEKILPGNIKMTTETVTREPVSIPNAALIRTEITETPISEVPAVPETKYVPDQRFAPAQHGATVRTYTNAQGVVVTEEVKALPQKEIPNAALIRMQVFDDATVKEIQRIRNFKVDGSMGTAVPVPELTDIAINAKNEAVQIEALLKLGDRAVYWQRWGERVRRSFIDHDGAKPRLKKFMGELPAGSRLGSVTFAVLKAIDTQDDKEWNAFKATVTGRPELRSEARWMDQNAIATAIRGVTVPENIILRAGKDQTGRDALSVWYKVDGTTFRLLLVAPLAALAADTDNLYVAHYDTLAQPDAPELKLAGISLRNPPAAVTKETSMTDHFQINRDQLPPDIAATWAGQGVFRSETREGKGVQGDELSDGELVEELQFIWRAIGTHYQRPVVKNMPAMKTIWDAILAEEVGNLDLSDDWIMAGRIWGVLDVQEKSRIPSAEWRSQAVTAFNETRRSEARAEAGQARGEDFSNHREIGKTKDGASVWLMPFEMKGEGNGVRKFSVQVNSYPAGSLEKGTNFLKDGLRGTAIAVIELRFIASANGDKTLRLAPEQFFPSKLKGTEVETLINRWVTDNLSTVFVRSAERSESRTESGVAAVRAEARRMLDKWGPTGYETLRIAEATKWDIPQVITEKNFPLVAGLIMFLGPLGLIIMVAGWLARELNFKVRAAGTAQAPFRNNENPVLVRSEARRVTAPVSPIAMTRDQLKEVVAEQAHRAILKAGISSQNVPSYSAEITAQYKKAFDIIRGLLDDALKGREASILVTGPGDDRTQLAWLVSDIVRKRMFQAERHFQPEVPDLPSPGLRTPAKTEFPPVPATSIEELLRMLEPSGIGSRSETRVQLPMNFNVANLATGEVVRLKVEEGDNAARDGTLTDLRVRYDVLVEGKKIQKVALNFKHDRATGTVTLIPGEFGFFGVVRGQSDRVVRESREVIVAWVKRMGDPENPTRIPAPQISSAEARAVTPAEVVTQVTAILRTIPIGSGESQFHLDIPDAWDSQKPLRLADQIQRVIGRLRYNLENVTSSRFPSDLKAKGTDVVTGLETLRTQLLASAALELPRSETRVGAVDNPLLVRLQAAGLSTDAILDTVGLLTEGRDATEVAQTIAGKYGLDETAALTLRRQISFAQSRSEARDLAAEAAGIEKALGAKGVQRFKEAWDKASQTSNVLVVDNHKIVLGGVRAVLERDGYKVETAGSVREALQKIRQRIAREGRPLIVTDNNMEEFSGAAFIQFMRQNVQSPRMILFSFSDLASDESKLMVPGQIEYVQKSGAAKDLTRALRSIAPAAPKKPAAPKRAEARVTASQVRARAVRAAIEAAGPEAAAAVDTTRLGPDVPALRRAEMRTDLSPEFKATVVTALVAGKSLVGEGMTQTGLASALIAVAKISEAPVPAWIAQVRKVLADLFEKRDVAATRKEIPLEIEAINVGDAVDTAELGVLVREQAKGIVIMADAGTMEAAQKQRADLLESAGRILEEMGAANRFDVIVVDRNNPKASQRILSKMANQLAGRSDGYVLMGAAADLKLFEPVAVNRRVMIDRAYSKDVRERIAASILATRSSEMLLTVGIGATAEEISQAVARMLEKRDNGLFGLRADALGEMLTIAMQVARAIQSAA